ncbi:MAG: AmmeMemoRadiSam system protein B [Candidatus Saccharicenans sp.]|nr:AmmeMemoRadiSam system protein B [Candidatus Saccharicenans sp.]
MKRLPYVAGYFYPQEPDLLRNTINSFVREGAEKLRAVGVVAPHAGYEYSGPVAGKVYSAVEIPASVVILSPAHHRISSLFALFDRGSWLTPLGEAKVESRLADLVALETDLISRDPEAHRKEHSIEVQIPFLQYFRPDVSIVPIMVSYQAGWTELNQLGQALAAAVRQFGQPVLLVASTDMSHYVNQKVAEELDFKAISFIEKLDSEGLVRVVTSFGISMCGFQPTAAMLAAARALNAREGRLISYQTSGERTGDYGEVVGYAGLAIL